MDDMLRNGLLESVEFEFPVDFLLALVASNPDEDEESELTLGERVSIRFRTLKEDPVLFPVPGRLEVPELEVPVVELLVELAAAAAAA